jgi:hypothetical protein
MKTWSTIFQFLSLYCITGRARLVTALKEECRNLDRGRDHEGV